MKTLMLKVLTDRRARSSVALSALVASAVIVGTPWQSQTHNTAMSGEEPFFMKLKKFLAGTVAPVSLHEDARRREFILNILVLASITLLTIAIVSSVFRSLVTSAESHANDALSLIVLVGILCVFFVLYALSQHGKALTASFVLIAIFFLLATYLAYHWGSDVPSAILLFALTIVMSGILVNSRFAFVMTALLAVLLGVITKLQTSGAITTNAYWRTEAVSIADVVVYAVILGILATVSWLSNREIERSLARARASESALMHERDTLEIRVEERTQELRQAELEKMSQTYRFVEFGRLASGLFHDLTNPLTALSLNIESIARAHGTTDPEQVALLAEDVSRARSATLHMQKLLDSMRRYLAHEGAEELVDVGRIIEESLRVLDAYARQHQVQLRLDPHEPVIICADAVALTQVLTNLVSNAVESFPQESEPGTQERIVTLGMQREGDQVVIRVGDTGSGITEAALKTIFEPFVSTKRASGGLGIGLSLAKRIVEKELNGEIAVQSSVGEGSIFSVYFPIREP